MNSLSNIWQHPKTSVAGLLIGIVTIGGVLSQQGITLGHAGNGTILTLVSGIATALLGLISRDPSTTTTTGTSTNDSTTKLGAWMLVALLLSSFFAQGCSASTVAQNIVNWTPAIVSAADTIDATVAVMDPADAVLIESAGNTFNAAAGLVEAQAKAYLANPSATTLQQLQAQALAFQTNVTTALLQAAHISNSASQQRVLAGLNAAVVGISAILALIQTIKGNTLTPSSVTGTAAKLSAVLPLIDKNAAVAMISQHEDISTDEARLEFQTGMTRLQAAGF